MESVTNPDDRHRRRRRHRRATGSPARPAPRSGSARSAAATTARSRCPSPASRPPTSRASWSTSWSRTRRTAAAAARSAAPRSSKIMSYLLQKYAVPPTGTSRAHAPHRVVTPTGTLSGVPDLDPAAPDRAGADPARGTSPAGSGTGSSSCAATVRRRRSPASRSARCGCSPATCTSPPPAPARTARRTPTRRSRDGAVAVLTDPAGAALCADAGVPVLVVERPRDVVGDLAARIYGQPGPAGCGWSR